MKKLTLLLCLILLAASLTGCAEKAKNVEGDLDVLMEKLYENLDESVGVPMGVMNTELSEDMEFPESGIVYYIGAKGIPFREGIASESLIGSFAHSVVLLRMEEKANVEEAKKQIRDGIDPMKWICQGVSREEVVVENIGDLVLLVLSHDGPAYRDAFLKLAP